MKEVIKIREVPASQRSSTFDEVVLGYGEQEILQEAARCLQCKNPVCIQGCPVGIDIKKFIYHITKKDYAASYLTIKEKNNFPSICGRVCPAEYQCRKSCILTKKGSPFASEQAINIHFLERFVGDYGNKEKIGAPKEGKDELAGQKVAVVGSGPAGLCCAGELARKGIKVTIFESLHEPGGVLRYGIPPFRLPRDILDFEIKYLEKLGVTTIPNYIIGKTKMLDELFKEGYSAVFLGLGAGTPSFLNIAGENLGNVYSANEFLTRVNLMSAFKYPEYHTPVNVGKRMIIIGGGNTAMDAARAAIRLQNMSGIKPNTAIFYRRTEIEMPARRLEIEHAKEEGIEFEFLVQPVAFGGDDNGHVRKLRCLRCELGEPDASGRRRPVAIANSEFETDCDVAIIAVGLQANTVLTNVTPGLKVDKYKDIIVDPETMQTSIAGVYAGGDIVGGEGTVIEAMSMGKKASVAIVDYLKSKAKKV
ncbi:MAG TPA: NADPH-dependent glutamate synthase [Candidatus Omnitrophota bacterium]|nr:NADPH-dependent glutamate synthase [Candidatus Omnitrophota bacterium]HPD85447.1 NADPH-dependent glutamate synthase [Candidatus Omnitrophota bacterium]HRZ04052.1 NADPH-dependent glutamate synthase [Candidatus Omnitrophota bacterium]